MRNFLRAPFYHVFGAHTLPIHEGKSVSPQRAETLAEAGRILAKLVVKKQP